MNEPFKLGQGVWYHWAALSRCNLGTVLDVRQGTVLSHRDGNVLLVPYPARIPPVGICLSGALLLPESMVFASHDEARTHAAIRTAQKEAREQQE